MSAGIVGYGCYVPPYRIKREEIGKTWGGGGRGELAIPGTDEDVVTMGVEATGNALRHAQVAPEEIGALYLASTSPPYAEHSSATIVADTCALSPQAERVDLAGSPRAGIGALKMALAAAQDGPTRQLVVASDYRAAGPGSELEFVLGAAAVAWVVGNQDCIATIEGSFSTSTQLLDRWRGSDERYVRAYDARFAGEAGYGTALMTAARGLLKQLAANVADYTYVVFQDVDGRAHRRVASKLGLTSEQYASTSLFDRVGDTGCSSALLNLAAVLDQAKPGNRILLLSYGSGIADAVSLTVQPEIETRRASVLPVGCYLERTKSLDYLAYAKQVGILKQVGDPVEMAVPAASPLFWRGNEELHRLVGAQCAKCGYINYPPSLRKICIRCGGTELNKVHLSRTGKIHTYGVNYYMPLPFQSPLPMIIADLDDGSRFVAHGTEMDPKEMHIGMDVELVLRAIANERGATVYGYKFRPVLAARQEVA